MNLPDAILKRIAEFAAPRDIVSQIHTILIYYMESGSVVDDYSPRSLALFDSLRPELDKILRRRRLAAEYRRRRKLALQQAAKAQPSQPSSEYSEPSQPSQPSQPSESSQSSDSSKIAIILPGNNGCDFYGPTIATDVDTDFDEKMPSLAPKNTDPSQKKHFFSHYVSALVASGVDPIVLHVLMQRFVKEKHPEARSYGLTSGGCYYIVA